MVVICWCFLLENVDFGYLVRGLGCKDLRSAGIYTWRVREANGASWVGNMACRGSSKDTYYDLVSSH